jgi:exoribonuclease R
MDLLSYNVGEGYCHAWYARRFLSPAKVDEDANPHSGLGLDCYVQWTSPIRRFGDLQVHCAVKRYLRRQRLIEIMTAGDPVPSGITSVDLGCDVPVLSEKGGYSCDVANALDEDIDYSERIGLLGATRTLQRGSQRYWMLEFVRRLKEQNPGKIFEGLVLGCTNPARRQYAIYVYELGLEWKYISPVGSLQAGNRLKLKVASVLPHNGQLTFTRLNA